MEKEQILETLKTELGQTSLSDRTISEYLDENMPEEGQEFNFGRHTKILKSLDGNFSADMKKKVEEFKKNYVPKPKEETKKQESENNNSDLLKRLEDLEKKLSEDSLNRNHEALRAKICSKVSSLKILNKNLWNDCVNNLKIEEKDTEETMTSKAKNLYETKLREYFGEGAIPYGGKSAEQSEASQKRAKEARESFKARMKSQGKL